jgi:hypothetical protein
VFVLSLSPLSILDRQGTGVVEGVKICRPK